MIAPSLPGSIALTRQSALHALDSVVRDELTAAARSWQIDQDSSIVLTAYDEVYRRTPEIGGHWTLFSARAADDSHEVVTATVAVEFDGDRPVDFHVGGLRDVVAGGCTAVALREALTECGGPLRQVTPLTLSLAAEETTAELVLAGHR